MKSALNKDFIRDIKKSKGRFLSIVLIVALGVAFFSGIKTAPIVMQNTTDKYYDDYNLMDIKVLSTLGLTDDDVNTIKDIKGVESVFPTYSMDVIAKLKSGEKVLKVHAIDIEKIEEGNLDYINRVKVVEGRLPQKSGECVLEKEKIKNLNIPIGSKINLESGTDEDLSTSLKNTEYEVVGYIETPYYLSYEKGSSSIGSGAVNGIVMIPQDNFNIEAYSEIFLTVDGAKEKNSYKDEYFDIIDKITNKLESVSDSRIDARYDEVMSEAQDELEKGKYEFEDKKIEVNEKLASAEADINKYKTQIKNGENELKDKKLKVQNQIKDGYTKLEAGQKQLEDGYVQYEAALLNYNQSKELAEVGLEAAEKTLGEVNIQVESIKQHISSIEERLSNEDVSEEEKGTLQGQLENLKYQLVNATSQLESGRSELESKKQDLKNAENQLSSTKEMLDSNSQKIKNERNNLISMEEKSKIGFESAQKELEKQKNKISQAESELTNSKVKATDELEKAEKKIKDAEDEISKIEKPEWYILDRNSHYSYAEFAGAANSIDALAKIFPVFFFSVAALVCLTTMTRMVDEQRINIGTLKALGYTTTQIAKKYILYALIASVTGSILGLLAGFTIFPLVVYNAYLMMFTAPPPILTFNALIAIGVTATSVLITTLAAYSACNNELRETPSVLMRPRAPKNGKRILLERVPFIWNKIGFIGKVTIRNIFRYKKRFLMTVLGISGCTALILTGLGIRDSIQMIVDGQYGSLFKYNMTVTLDNNASNSERNEVIKYIDNDKRIMDYQLINNQNGKIKSNNIEKEVTIVVPENTSKIGNFISLVERKSQEKINLGKSGVVLTEKVARNLGIKKGDNIELLNGNDKKVTVKVVGITENYISHYAYMSKEYYEELFGRDVSYNRIIGTLKDTSTKSEESVSADLMKNTPVKGVSFNTGSKENFNNMISNLSAVVVMMTVSAGALAFVVLYNLTNVNISERIREIATIKVLGFYDKEVSAYIYRENIILTVIGTGVGLGLGLLLHQFIMTTVEVDNMMFGRIIQSRSYIIAAILTISLGCIVNWAMYYKLKTVEMVESLKSVD
ncbi:ABC transporter permease [Romboutsia weinsteinii]|uniref:ABC transporter permease n=1 Tax=Romboutsia weinsteinii TaxID=2020949 RepID=A0A371J334_9FIRM|nr:FtsX-like permease family protein [Romboutsia weinsteinii]RDY27202.1 ABC transporter permease [Romboutsia weinsteinii]